MALFMVRSYVPPENRNDTLKQYANNPVRDEVTQVGDWVAADGSGAFHLMEADDAQAILDVVLLYSDRVKYEVTPVVLAEDFFALVQKHGLM